MVDAKQTDVIFSSKHLRGVKEKMRSFLRN